MLRLSDIRDLVATLDDGRRSPVADVVAARWGYPPGAARFRRSSANHVFALTGASGEVEAFLRFAPRGHRSHERMLAAVALMRGLAGPVQVAGPVHVAGPLLVVDPVASVAGRWVEEVDTVLGPVRASVVTAAVGEQVEADDLTPARAVAWGRALATLHATDVEIDLPDTRVAGDAGVADDPDDPDLARALAALRERLDRLPRDRNTYGVAHGDFELDNLVWTGDRPTALDFDEAARSWYVADIAYATRDLAAGGPLFGTFLAGYREVRALPDGDLRHLPLFAAMHAAADLARLAPVRDAGTAATDPDWLVRLRGRLDERAAELRAEVVAAAGAGFPE